MSNSIESKIFVSKSKEIEYNSNSLLILSEKYYFVSAD